jgi:hypothetical protein
MKLKPEKLADLRIKHLEMLQAVISRIAGQGATLKNYCITLTTAVCGLAVTLQKPLVALLSLMPVTILALLDAQYLRLERRFRALYEKERSGNWSVAPAFEISSRRAPKVSYWGAFLSWSILAFYAPLAIAVVIVMLIARNVYGQLV